MLGILLYLNSQVLKKYSSHILVTELESNFKLDECPKKSSALFFRRELWSSGYGRRLTIKRAEFESQHLSLNGSFFTFICCKIVLFGKRPSGVAHFNASVYRHSYYVIWSLSIE